MKDSIKISNTIDDEKEKKKDLDFYKHFHEVSSEKRYRALKKVMKPNYKLRKRKPRQLPYSVNVDIEDDHTSSECSNDSEFDIDEHVINQLSSPKNNSNTKYQWICDLKSGSIKECKLLF